MVSSNNTNTTQSSNSLSSKKRGMSGVSGITMAGCIAFGVFVSGSEVRSQMPYHESQSYHWSFPSDSSRVSHLDNNKVAETDCFLVSSNGQLIGAIVSCNPPEIPILNSQVLAYNVDMTSFNEGTGALALKKTVAEVNSGREDKPNWNKTVSSLFEGTRPFNSQEVVMHANVLKKRSVTRGKLYNI